MEDMFGMITLLLIALGIGAVFFLGLPSNAVKIAGPGCFSLTWGASAGGLRAGSMSCVSRSLRSSFEWRRQARSRHCSNRAR